MILLYKFSFSFLLSLNISVFSFSHQQIQKNVGRLISISLSTILIFIVFSSFSTLLLQETTTYLDNSQKIFHYYFMNSLKKYQVWLDCDPGLDDTLAIILAAKTDSINLIGLSTSAGNTSLENTTKNALNILYNIGRSDVVVVQGSNVLVHGEPHLAEHMHAPGGLGGVKIEDSDKMPITQNSFSYIRDKIIQSSQKVIWANTGALTNLCFLLRKYPELNDKIQRIVLMGGAIGKGNITPAAEFNIFFDPEAFREVLKYKGNIPLVMIPLQVTHTVIAKQDFFNFLQKRDQTPFAKAILQMLCAYKQMYSKSGQPFEFPPIHDPTVINYILYPEDFVLKKAFIDVDIEKVSYGRTNCYFYYPTEPQRKIQTNDWVAVEMKNHEQFWGLFKEIFDKLFKVNS